MRMLQGLLAAALMMTALCAHAAPTRPAEGLGDEHRARGQALAAKAIAYLRAQQEAETGEWRRNPTGPTLPAITGLAVTGMLLDPAIDAGDPAVASAIDAILRYRQPDGGFYDRILPSYNTAICLSALAHAARESEASRARQIIGTIPGARRFLIGLQFSEDALIEGGDELSSAATETVARVTPDHPFYGGIGYGRSGRPDNSNLNIMLQALYDSGLPSDHEAYRRALVFLQRTQMLDEVNDMPYADGSTQGGFIYATSPNSEEIGVGESKAGLIEETLSTGEVASRLRSYGSMTYAGFKSYVYADLDRDDPRVQAARRWIGHHYTLEENPGIGTDGLYYYFLTFARALDAWGEAELEVAGGARDWRADLIDRLARLQEEDGSFRPVDDRWMEGDPVLITAYSLIALQHALYEHPAPTPIPDR